MAVIGGLEVVLLVKDKKGKIDAYYSNETMKKRMAHRVGEFYQGECEKKFCTVEVQAGSGKVTSKHLLSKKKKNSAASDSDNDSDKENEK